MSISIGNNTASLRVQRELARASASLSETFERLSSGMRINRASDDAAGLAVSMGLNTDARIYTQAVRNLSDGVSALHIADGAVSQLSGIVTRIKELAEQSANGTYAYKQRSALDNEAQALSKEFHRIIKTTEFNDVKLLDGSQSLITLQAGYGSGGTITSGFGGAVGVGTFKTRGIYSTGGQPFSIELGDVNNDGIQDMLTGDLGGFSMSVHIGNGDGSFKAAVITGIGSQVRHARYGDVNNDGNLDIVTVSELGGYLNVFTGNGNGTFKAPSTISLANGPEYLTLADMNNDGTLDIVTNNLDDTTSILIGYGDGNFKSGPAYAASNITTSHDIADFNGDGFLDIIVTGHTSTDVFMGNGDGTLRAARVLSNFHATSAIAGDYDNDGNLDFMALSAQMELFLGNGNGTFKAPVQTSSGTSGYLGRAADFNNDGYLDYVTSDNVNGPIVMYYGNGNGTFKAGVTFDSGTSSRGINLGDVNGDGVIDILSTDASNNTANVFVANTKSGTSPLLQFSLKSMADSRQAMGMLDNTLKNLALQTSIIGSFQSRLQTALGVVHTSIESYRSANSRIMDADVGVEFASLTRNQILQQAGASVLAQANVQPSLALTLLRQ